MRNSRPMFVTIGLPDHRQD